jgi:hypothetical protein
MINRFMNWCLNLEPDWVAVVVCLCVVIGLVIGFYTNGWAIPILAVVIIAYAWYEENA